MTRMCCVLCAVVDGSEPAEIVHEDSRCLVIVPRRSMAPLHLLLFPRDHYSDLPTYLATEPAAAGHLMRQAAVTAKQHGLAERGYRLAWNFGPDTNQRIM